MTLKNKTLKLRIITFSAAVHVNNFQLCRTQKQPLAFTWVRPGHRALVERDSFTNVVKSFQSYDIVGAWV